MKLIYHIATEAGWEAARAAGEVVAESLATEGFVHCSRQGQLLAVAERFFAGQSGLVALAIDEAGVAPWLVNEGPSGVGDPFAKDVFPHVYGPIPLSAVVTASPLAVGTDGQFVWPNALPRS